jgi:hypothetical protein
MYVYMAAVSTPRLLTLHSPLLAKIYPKSETFLTTTNKWKVKIPPT